MNDVVAQAHAWMAEDPDPQTRAQLQQWLDDGGTVNDDNDNLRP